MGLFNDIFGGLFNRRPSKEDASVEIYGGEEQDDAIDMEPNMPKMTQQRKQESESVANHELPSVNRSRGGSRLMMMAGYLLLFGGGVAMLWAILGPDFSKEKAKPKKFDVTNRMPRIEAPKLLPPPPPQPSVVPQIQRETQAPIKAKVEKKVREPDWTDRKRGGVSVRSVGNAADKESQEDSNGAGRVNAKTAISPAESSWLAVKLKAIATPDSYAQILPDRDYLITKGTALDCALETAIDSTLSGLTTCRLTRDIYSDNGRVVLLDRGSQLVGEYQGGLVRGQARVFVLWTRAKTPKGVIIDLDSPGVGPLGRTGHDGFVDRHFLERFGAAVIFSLVKDALIIAQDNGNSNITIGGSGSDTIATEILKDSIGIRPTLHINQGDHINIMVARDLDFSSVYALDLKG